MYCLLKFCLDVDIQEVELNWAGILILSGNEIVLQYHCTCLLVHAIDSWFGKYIQFQFMLDVETVELYSKKCLTIVKYKQ